MCVRFCARKAAAAGATLAEVLAQSVMGAEAWRQLRASGAEGREEEDHGEGTARYRPPGPAGLEPPRRRQRRSGRPVRRLCTRGTTTAPDARGAGGDANGCGGGRRGQQARAASAGAGSAPRRTRPTAARTRTWAATRMDGAQWEDESPEQRGATSEDEGEGPMACEDAEAAGAATARTAAERGVADEIERAVAAPPVSAAAAETREAERQD